MDNRFIILVGSYNNEKWVKQNIESVTGQIYKNWKLIYYNAASTDKTYELAKQLADKDDRIVLFSDKSRHLKTHFFRKSVSITPIHNTDIVCILDGDDFLSSPEVLSYLNEVYKQTSCWMTYGGMICWEGGDKTREAFPQNSLPPDEVFRQKLYRKDMWRYSHMRTCRGFLWKRLKEEDFISKTDGEYMTLDDLCTVYPMLEMCPSNKIFRVEEPIYIWNASESRGCAENKENNKGQIYETEIRNRPQRNELTTVSPVLAGGLGNQMFEVAAAASLAKDNGALLVINPTEHILPNQGRNVNTYTDNVFSRIVIDKKPPVTDAVSVNSIYYQPIPFKGVSTRLQGHFQSYKYFHHNRQYIRDLFAPTMDVEEKLERDYFLEDTRNVTAIQVRRGDYVKFPDHHPLLTPEYYAKAVKMTACDEVWVFSDDIEWCKQNLNLGTCSRYVKDEDYIEMYLMGLCKNIVISNSSFGWWAAYLGNANVFAPNPWFGPALINDGFKPEDLIPPDWTQIYVTK
jgi:glycosyltransferase involved in cell wall biosynthesis